LDKFVIQATGRVVGTRVPIQPRPAVSFRTLDKVLNQEAPDTSAAELWLDEKVFEVADQVQCPCAFVQDAYTEPYDQIVDGLHTARNRRAWIENAVPGLCCHRLGHIGVVEDVVARP